MENVSESLEKMRQVISEEPDGIVAGDIPAGCQDELADLQSKWNSFAEFLKLADGATLGSVDLWSHDHLPEQQYPVIDFPAGAARWLVVGQLLYEPLALEANTGALWLFRRNGPNEGEPLGSFDEFLLRLLSEGYADVVADGAEDECWDLLAKAGLR